jgi:hypothetical protein
MSKVKICENGIEVFHNLMVNKEKSDDTTFEELFLEAVDEALSSLGKTAKEATYYRIGKTVRIKKEEIPHEVEKFATAIESIFSVGAALLEIQIMKRIYEKAGKNFEYYPKRGELSFTEYVHALRLLHLLWKKQGRQNLSDESAPILPPIARDL